MFDIQVDDKYRVIFDEKRFRALRNGQEWRDLTGDGLILALAMALDEARAKIKELTNQENINP